MNCNNCNIDKPLNQHGHCLSCQKDIDGYIYTKENKAEKRELVKDLDNQMKVLLQYREDVYRSMDLLLGSLKEKITKKERIAQ